VLPADTGADGWPVFQHPAACYTHLNA
jgi:hypothetical protein